MLRIFPEIGVGLCYDFLWAVTHCFYRLQIRAFAAVAALVVAMAQAHSVSWRRTVNSVKVVGAPSRSCAEHSEALVFIVSRAGQSGRSRDSRVVWAAGQRVDQTELLRAARRQQGPDGLMATAMAGGRARVTR